MLNIKVIILSLAISSQVLDLNATKCDGEHEYVDEYGECQRCEMCNQGLEPRKHCGYGYSDQDYVCEPCDSVSFSKEKSYSLCKTCTQCDKWNSYFRERCTRGSDAVCGECYTNYYRLIKADGSIDPKCHKCSPDTQLAECEQNSSPIFVPIVVVVVVIAIIILAIFCSCILWRRWKKKNQQSRVQGKSVLLGNQSMESTTSASLEPLTTKPSSSQCLPEQLNVTVTSLSTPTYSNLPTVEYDRHFPSHPHGPETALLKKGNSSSFSAVAEEDSYAIKVDSFDTSSIRNIPEKVKTHEGNVAAAVALPVF